MKSRATGVVMSKLTNEPEKRTAMTLQINSAVIVQQVMAGSHYALVFGAQPRSSGPSSANTSGLALWGVLGIVFALLTAGVVGLIVRRRR